ncbi:MAG: hypothetical protein R2875_00700 [Desulfobacterales bacterium]
MDGIVAAYQMRPMYERYCAPVPQECLQYIVVPKSQKKYRPETQTV